MVTGVFIPLKKDIDPNAPVDSEMKKVMDKDGDGIISTQELNDYEMKQ